MDNGKTLYGDIIGAIKCIPEKLGCIEKDEMTDAEIVYVIHKIMFTYCGDCIKNCKNCEAKD